VAATTGLFSPAPERVRGSFDRLNDIRVDSSKAIRIGTIDAHAAYAAPTADGGFCLWFASAQRSGPTGAFCTQGDGVREGEIALAPQSGGDGGFVFGRVGSESAATVEIQLPGGGGAITTPVRPDRFFLAQLP
jgi:hypothetical protein